MHLLYVKHLSSDSTEGALKPQPFSNIESSEQLMGPTGWRREGTEAMPDLLGPRAPEEPSCTVHLSCHLREAVELRKIEAPGPLPTRGRGEPHFP